MRTFLTEVLQTKKPERTAPAQASVVRLARRPDTDDGIDRDAIYHDVVFVIGLVLLLNVGRRRLVVVKGLPIVCERRGMWEFNGKGRRVRRFQSPLG